jgi:hypothetical protein
VFDIRVPPGCWIFSSASCQLPPACPVRVWSFSHRADCPSRSALCSLRLALPVPFAPFPRVSAPPVPRFRSSTPQPLRSRGCPLPALSLSKGPLPAASYPSRYALCSLRLDQLTSRLVDQSSRLLPAAPCLPCESVVPLSQGRLPLALCAMLFALCALRLALESGPWSVVSSQWSCCPVVRCPVVRGSQSSVGPCISACRLIEDEQSFIPHHAKETRGASPVVALGTD